MKYCPYCGAAVLDDAAFCMSCGKSIPVTSAQATPPVQEDYDGYYDDVPADDNQSIGTNEPSNPGIVKNIVLICAGTGLVIIACILWMILL